MAGRHDLLLARIGPVLGVMLVLAGCTPGGQFDPSEVLSTDIFDTKKKLKGEREPVFPNGVPGAESGVPPDLVKGYQPPPEPAAETAETAPAAAAAEAKPKPKPKPKPKLARAPAPPPPPMQSPQFQQPAQQDPAWNQKVPTAAAPHDAVWDRVPTTAAQTAQPGQPAWPVPQQSAPAQQTAQPAQPAWPKPSQ